MKALVVEDMLTSRTLLSNQLRRIGIEPVLCADGLEAVEQFKQHRPDIILLDIILPGLDGFEVAKRIRQLERDGEWTPIIFLTGRSSDEDLERGIAVGGDDYLSKPVSEIVLAAKVRAMQRIAQMRYSLVVLTRRLDETNRQLTRLSAVDGLTGVANRRQFDEQLAREWGRATRHESKLGLLLCDVDHFKQFNDIYGHQSGDDCLRQVASALAAQIKRPTDLVARYGGEEFVVVLPDTDLIGARSIAEGMREAVAQLRIAHSGSPRGVVTLSFGAASMAPTRDGPPSADLVRAADIALYDAKAAGRDQVAVMTEGRG